MLLALDTSTPTVTVALHDGSRVLAESTVSDGRRHGELLAPAIQRVLSAAAAQPADLTRVAVGVGPGPFTGLRVGLVTALTVGAVLGVDVAGVCSLDVVALVALGGRRPGGDGEPGGPLRTGFVVVTDARRREVYWARYDGAGRRVGPPAVDLPGVVGAAAAAAAVPVVGPAAALYPFPGCAAGPVVEVSAAVLAGAVAAGWVQLLPAAPLYLRRPDATAPGPRKRVLT